MAKQRPDPAHVENTVFLWCPPCTGIIDNQEVALVFTHTQIFTVLTGGKLEGTFRLDNKLMMPYRLTIPKPKGSRLVQILIVRLRCKTIPLVCGSVNN